jgi:hypothetical protein
VRSEEEEQKGKGKQAGNVRKRTTYQGNWKSSFIFWLYTLSVLLLMWSK